MTPRFTHFVYSPSTGVDLVAGDVVQCRSCNATMFRDYAFLEDDGDDVAGEPDSQWGQLALGRVPLPDNAQPADEGQMLCDGCILDSIPP